MLLDAEDAARLERGEACGQRLIGIAAIHPVVQIAEREHEIGGAGRRDVEMTGSQGGLVDRAHLALHGIDARVPLGVGLLCLFVGGWLECHVIRSLLRQVGTEYLSPVAAARPELDYGHVGLHTEKRELRGRMARAVARHEIRAARRIRDGGRKGCVRGGGRGAEAPQSSREGRGEVRNPKCRCIHRHVSLKFFRIGCGAE